MKPIRTTFTASLANPNDPTSVTLVADAVGVGKTHRLATGQIVTWTAEFLRAKAHTFVNKPVNIDLDEDGLPTGHSRRVVGVISKAFFDEARQVITVEATLWPHYSPSVVARIKSLAVTERLEVSMELIPEGELIANDDDSVSPVDGEFSGLGIVRIGADPRNQVILVAALAEDEGVEVRMNLDQITEAVARKLGHRADDVDAATQTVTDNAPADSEEITASTDEDAPGTHVEEDAVLAAELTEELKASLREELLAEIQPQLDTLTQERDDARQALADRDAADATKELVATRMAELETILPDEKAKDKREALCAALDEASFIALKETLTAAAEVKGGIGTDATAHAGTEEVSTTPSDDAVDVMAKRALAAAGYAAPAKDK